MTARTKNLVALAMLIGAMICSIGRGAEHCAPGDGKSAAGSCANCGCRTGCTKVCRRVEDKKKVTVTCWGCEEEEFCLPGPSTPECNHSEDVCGETGWCCLWNRPFVWTEWCPSDCAKMFTKKKLMKRTVIKTVPSYKWVVEDLCPACQKSAAK
jgi:hypothetical protein